MGARRWTLMIGLALATLLMPSVAGAVPPHDDGADAPLLLVEGLEGGSGSTIGPDGALYVTEGIAGRVSRVDPWTGEVTTFAEGLPTRIAPIGGAMDVVFRGRTAYVLVTLVGEDVGGHDVVGIYRVDGPDSFTVVADLGAFSIANPPSTPFDIPSGVQYALESYRGGFVVTDGHHNRVLQVTRDGDITELATFGNVVPTGLEVIGRTVLLTLAGPVPHLPQDGTVLALRPPSMAPREIASGAPLLVDVERGRGNTLYALAQGVFRVGDPEGTPAQPDTGQLLRVRNDGTLEVLVEGLDRPTSFELLRHSALVVTLSGEVWRIDGIRSGGGHGRS